MDETQPQETVDITIPVDPQPAVEQSDSPQVITESAPSDTVHESTEESKPSEEIVRNPETGQIVKGVAQDTNKNGTAGRPCLYCQNKEIFQKKAEDFIAYYRENAEGKKAVPWIEEMALEMNTTDTNLVNWANKTDKTNEPEHPELFAAYSMVKMLQKLRLQKRAIGRYNPAGPLALLKFNHGMIETSKQLMAGDKASDPIQIEIIDETNPFKNEE